MPSEENEKREEKKESKNQTAEEIAQIMVENMKANMANPDFWAEKERRMQEARDEVLKTLDARIKAQKEQEEED